MQELIRRVGDPDARLGYAYVMKNKDFYLFDDPQFVPPDRGGGRCC